MRPALSIYLSLLLSLFAAGCATSMRYTENEIKDFPPNIQENIKKGEVATGMTKNQVRYAWGGPKVESDLPVSEGGQPRVEWTYERMGVFRSRLIFTGDKLTEIITSEPWIAR